MNNIKLNDALLEPEQGITVKQLSDFLLRAVSAGKGSAPVVITAKKWGCNDSWRPTRVRFNPGLKQAYPPSFVPKEEAEIQLFSRRQILGEGYLDIDGEIESFERDEIMMEHAIQNADCNIT